MLAYLAVAAILTGLAFIETGAAARIKWSAAIGATVMALFAGLRWETGTDWMEYQRYYDNLGSLVTQSLRFEPGFAALTSLAHAVGLPFQGVLFLIACFTMWAVYRVAKVYCPRPALVLLFYFGLVFMTAEMAVIRQTLGFSFLLLALVVRRENKLALPIALSIAAASIHTFCAVVAPLLFVRVRPPTWLWWVVSLVAGLGLAVTVSGFQAWTVVLGALADYLPEVAGVRAAQYAADSGVGLSPFALLLLAWHLAFLFLVTRRKRAAPPDQLYLFTVWIAVATIVAHTWFAGLPLIWNRLMALSLLCEAIELARTYHGLFATPLNRTAIILGTGAASAGALALVLSRPESLPFVPYQFGPYYWVTGQLGDGRERYMIQLDRSTDLITQRRR
jgi:hypothetical protein